MLQLESLGKTVRLKGMQTKPDLPNFIAVPESDPELATAVNSLAIDLEKDFGPARKENFALLAKKDGKIIGMVKGLSHWEWLYVVQLWVAPAERSKGLGAHLMAEAENIAKKKSCLGVYVDTFHPRARSFYLSLGYEEFGQLPGMPRNGARYFFSKKL